MSRVEDLSDGELLNVALAHDPDPGVAVVPLPWLVEIVRRRSLEAVEQPRLADELHANQHPTATTRRHRNRLRREAERYHAGP